MDIMELDSKMIRFLRFVWENIEDIISLLIVIVLFIIDKFFSIIIKPELFFYLIFVILITITIGNIRNRNSFFKQSNSLLKTINFQLEQKVFDPIKACNFFQKPPVYEDPFPTSGEILISGISLLETIGSFQKKLDDAITSGARVRIILLDEENSTNIDQLIERSWGKVNQEYYKKRIKSTYDQIQVIAEKIKGTGKVKGTLEVGKLSFVPSFGIIAIIPKDITKRIINIKIYHHLTNNEKPYFSVEYCRDKVWFDFFLNQFNEEWKKSKTVQII